MKLQQKRALANHPQPRAKTHRLRAVSGGPTLELFQKEECPFSHTVRQKLSDLGLDFVAHSIPDTQDLKHKELVNAGGKDQVPFLIDHKSGVKLYESEAIVSYLEKEYGTGGMSSSTSPTGIKSDFDQVKRLAQRTLTDLQGVAFTSWNLVKKRIAMEKRPLRRLFKDKAA